MTVSIMIDTQIYDVIAANAKLRELVELHQREERIRLLSTHIEEGELAAIPPQRNVGQASIVQTDRVGAAVFVLGYSRLDEDRLGTPEADSAFIQIQNGGLRHTEDAMIGATASVDADILVTDDARLKKRFESLGCSTRVVSSGEFVAYLEALS